MEISSLKLHPKLQKLWSNIEENKEKSGKHKLLLDYSESLLMSISTYIIAEYRKAGIEYFKYEKLFIENNKNLSTGTYQMFLREGAKVLKKEAVNGVTLLGLISGKNDLTEVAKFGKLFDIIKKEINQGKEDGFNIAIEEYLKSSNGNFGKTNLLGFFDSFIQLRNRVAHPHKEIKGVLVHWPSSYEYYDIINKYLFEALNEVNIALKDFWEFKEGELIEYEGSHLLKLGDEEEDIDFDFNHDFSLGSKFLIREDGYWLSGTFKEVVKVGQKILEMLDEERKETQKVQNMQELEVHIEAALDDGQISSDEMRFFDTLARTKLNVETEELKKSIYKVATKMGIEDPFPEVDKRLIEAIDNALTSGEYNAFFLKLMAQNYNLDDEQYTQIVSERSEALGVDISKLGSNSKMSFSKDKLNELIEIYRSIHWIQGIQSINRTGVKGLFTVEKGQHSTYGNKEYFHKLAFDSSQKFVRSVMTDLQDKMSSDNEWQIETSNWQQGNMTGYVWVKLFPKNKDMSSELGLGLSLHANDYAIGFMPEWGKVRNTQNVNSGLLLNLFREKLNVYLNDFRKEFMEHDNLMIWRNAMGQDPVKLSIPRVLADIPNWINHFFDFHEIRFFKQYEDLDEEPLAIYNHLELAFSLFGGVIENVLFDYHYMIGEYVNPLEKQKDIIFDICGWVKEQISVNTEAIIEEFFDVKSGNLFVQLSQTIKKETICIKIGFWENLTGDIHFGIKILSTENEEQEVFSNIRSVINRFSKEFLDIEESCAYNGFYSGLILVSNENGEIDEENIIVLKTKFTKAWNTLVKIVSTEVCSNFFGISPKLKVLDDNKELIDSVLDEIIKAEIVTNKISTDSRDLVFRMQYGDIFGSKKKYGSHFIHYGFDFSSDDIRFFVRIVLENRLKGAKLLNELKQLNNDQPQFEEVQLDKDETDKTWVMNSLSDDQITASSEYNRNHSAKLARINTKPKYANWSSKKLDDQQWISVDLGKVKKIFSIKTQGRYNKDEWVTKYYLSWSSDGKNWDSDETKVYEGNNDSNSEVIQNICSPLVARYLRIHPIEWHNWISMRFDVNTSDVSDKDYELINYFSVRFDSSELKEKCLANFQCCIADIKIHCGNAFGF